LLAPRPLLNQRDLAEDAPTVIVKRVMTARSSISEKPFRDILDFRVLCFMEAPLESYDQFQRDRHGDVIGVRTAHDRLGGHGDELGVGGERLDIPADIVKRLAIRGGCLAAVVRHRIAAHGSLREVDDSAVNGAPVPPLEPVVLIVWLAEDVVGLQSIMVMLVVAAGVGVDPVQFRLR
jgi:hypothetical protein